MFKTYDLSLVTLLAASLLLSSLPACAAPHQELAVRSFFLVCYDSARKLPIWTVYQLDPRLVRAQGLTKPSHFRQDAALRGPIARNADYAGSGYSRGHLVPAADAAWSLESLRATYLLSNAVPQRQSVNAGRLRQLESSIRKLATGAEERHLESTVRLFTYEAMPVHPSDAAPDRCFQRARSATSPALVHSAARTAQDFSPTLRRSGEIDPRQ